MLNMHTPWAKACENTLLASIQIVKTHATIQQINEITPNNFAIFIFSSLASEDAFGFKIVTIELHHMFVMEITH